MDPQFKSMLFRVLAIGGIVLTLGTSALLVAFWRLGKATPQSEPRAFAVLRGAIGFILLCCVILLVMSPSVK